MALSTPKYKTAAYYCDQRRPADESRGSRSFQILIIENLKHYIINIMMNGGPLTNLAALSPPKSDNYGIQRRSTEKSHGDPTFQMQIIDYFKNYS